MTTLGLHNLAGRCSAGFDLATQHGTLCPCPEGATTEWAIFTAALRTAARDGLVHQGDVRPLVRGRIKPKHIGLCWKRARREGLVREVNHERSNDTAGRNSHRMEAVYELRAAMTVAQL